MDRRSAAVLSARRSVLPDRPHPPRLTCYAPERAAKITGCLGKEGETMGWHDIDAARRGPGEVAAPQRPPRAQPDPA